MPHGSGRGRRSRTTGSASKAFQRKSAALARRCGKVSGWLLPHISTADTARDLDHLRRLVGDRTLTYVGLSYGTYLGQTYANMFPGRVRAMLLDGVVDPVAYSRNAEARAANSVSSTDAVFDKFLDLCRRAGPGGLCARRAQPHPGGARAAAVRAGAPGARGL